MSKRTFHKASRTSHTGECVMIAPPIDDPLKDPSRSVEIQSTEFDPGYDTSVVFGDTKLDGREDDVKIPMNAAAFTIFAAGLEVPDQWLPVQ